MTPIHHHLTHVLSESAVLIDLLKQYSDDLSQRVRADDFETDDERKATMALHEKVDIAIIKHTQTLRIGLHATQADYMVSVDGQGAPAKVHNTYAAAEAEAQRLSTHHKSPIRLLALINTLRPKTIHEWEHGHGVQP